MAFHLAIKMKCPDCGSEVKCPCCGGDRGFMVIGFDDDLVVHRQGPVRMALFGADGVFGSGGSVCITNREGLKCYKSH